MAHKAFITNTSTKTLKKRIDQLIKHSRELKFLVISSAGSKFIWYSLSF